MPQQMTVSVAICHRPAARCRRYAEVFLALLGALKIVCSDWFAIASKLASDAVVCLAKEVSMSRMSVSSFTSQNGRQAKFHP